MRCIMLGVSVPVPKVKVTVRVQMSSHHKYYVPVITILSDFDREVILQKKLYLCTSFFQSETDPSGITKEDLIRELRYCLASTPKFAQYCLPLLLEKLTSDLKSAKIDSLQTLVKLMLLSSHVKTPKHLDTQQFAVIILKFKQRGFTIE